MNGNLTHQRLSQVLATLADVQLELDHERLRRGEAETLLARLFDSLSDGVLITDPHGVILQANPAAEALFGLSIADLQGRPAQTLYRDEVPATPWALLEAAPSGQLSKETTVLGGDGVEREVSLSCGVVRDEDGKIQGAVHAARDLSEVHRLLRQVEAAEARWRLLAYVSNQLTAPLGPREALPDLLEHLEAELGCGLAVVLTHERVVDQAIVSPTCPDGAAVASLEGAAPPRNSAVATTIATGHPVHVATMTSDFPFLGTPVPGVRSAAVLPLALGMATDGVLLAVASEPDTVDDATVGLMEEVATRIGLTLANEEMHESLARNQAAREAAEYRDEILAAISHDIKTPLSVLSGLTRLLDEPHAIDSHAEIRDGIDRQIRRLRRLVTQFLDYIRLEAGHNLAGTPTPTKLDEIVTAACEVEGGRHRIHLDLPGSLPPVLADPGRLDLALVNLVTNALKYAPAPTPVTIRVREVGHHVEIDVSDEGPGIAPAEQRHLFQKFTRGRGETGIEGTGLGLYMTRQLMRSQGGEVRMTSQVGHGSCFTLVVRRAETLPWDDEAR